jgi:HSP20 family protein
MEPDSEDGAMDDLGELKGRINRLFEEIVSGRSGPGTEDGGDWSPKVDLYELPDRLVLRADVPGMANEDLDVRIEGGQLVLRGRREQPTDLDATAMRRLERPFGSFLRRYALPDGIDPEQVRATYTAGVLEIVIRKREETAVRHVPVQST